MYLQNHLFVKNIEFLKTFIRVIFGFVWLIDGCLKLSPDMPSVFSQLITQAGKGQPAWLSPWFNFWSNLVTSNPVPFVYSVAFLEIGLGLALIFGFLRKIAYIIGMLFSLVIWSVPEGFGGPYGPSSTDIGTAIIYSFVFLCLLIINATYGPSKYSIDAIVETRYPKWKILAELQ